MPYQGRYSILLEGHTSYVISPAFSDDDYKSAQCYLMIKQCASGMLAQKLLQTLLGIKMMLIPPPLIAMIRARSLHLRIKQRASDAASGVTPYLGRHTDYYFGRRSVHRI